VLSYSKDGLCVIDLGTGLSRRIPGTKGISQSDVTWGGSAAWSPSGQWIAAVVDQRMVLIDAQNPSRRKDRGSAGDGRVVWSPDSKQLLLLKSDLLCTLSSFGFFESLQAVNVETGKKAVIKISHCKVAGGWVGWIDSESFRVIRDEPALAAR
jgi:hypothetical protein